jgi:2-oxoglutarate dehydrogenase E1 component
VHARHDREEREEGARVVLCSGKVYYDLIEEARAKRKIEDVAIVRVEQLYPFPRKDAAAELAKYANGEGNRLVPGGAENQGAWYQIKHHLQALGRTEAVAVLRRPLALAGAGLWSSSHCTSRRSRSRPRSD